MMLRPEVWGVSAIALWLGACGPSLGSSCMSDADCGNSHYCSKRRHGGAQRAEPPPPPPACASDAECTGDKECVHGSCLSEGECEHARP
jgi:hypothetical protein